MARKVFYSFHYDADYWRVQQVRKIGMVEGNQLAKENDWEAVLRGGQKAVKQWIDGQMRGKSCVVVLIGQDTAGREWINYEIRKGWNEGKGVLGIYIHDLKDRHGNTARKGDNPFDGLSLPSGEQLSDVVRVYDPGGWFTGSKDTYANIKDNLADWIEEAIEIRSQF